MYGINNVMNKPVIIFPTKRQQKVYLLEVLKYSKYTKKHLKKVSPCNIGRQSLSSLTVQLSWCV